MIYLISLFYTYIFSSSIIKFFFRKKKIITLQHEIEVIQNELDIINVSIRFNIFFICYKLT